MTPLERKKAKLFSQIRDRFHELHLQEIWLERVPHDVRHRFYNGQCGCVVIDRRDHKTSHITFQATFYAPLLPKTFFDPKK